MHQGRMLALPICTGTHWRSVLPKGVMLEVQYEELVAGLEHQARKILAYCELEWDDACLAFHETRRPIANRKRDTDALANL
jgi:hypothetical protein